MPALFSAIFVALAPGTARADTCDAYGEAERAAEVGGSTVDEASGLAVSHVRDGVFFTHGDRGADPIVASFDRTGRLLDEHVVEDAPNRDWEDLASAPCPDEGWCLYIGDIGDNDAERSEIAVYVIREPEPGETNVKTIAQYEAVYPSGPRDAEAMMVHPCTGRIHIVTKATDGNAEVYRFPVAPEGVVTLEQVASLQLQGPVEGSRAATGGAWDDDGDRVAVRTNDRIFEWRTDPDRPNAHWTSPPLELVGTTEAQGEGIAYGPGGDLYTVGEGAPIPLTRYACESTAPGEGVCEFPQTGRRCGCAAPGPSGGAGLSGGLVVAAIGLLLHARRKSGVATTLPCRRGRG